MIANFWEESLYKYITGIVKNKDQKLIAINGVADHIHFLISIKPNCCLSDLVREIKKSSNEYIRNENFCKTFFWQEGYGAFSYSHSQLGNVINYIQNQKIHHQRSTFKEEYVDLLQKFEIEFDAKYLFDWIK